MFVTACNAFGRTNVCRARYDISILIIIIIREIQIRIYSSTIINYLAFYYYYYYYCILLTYIRLQDKRGIKRIKFCKGLLCLKQSSEVNNNCLHVITLAELYCPFLL